MMNTTTKKDSEHDYKEKQRMATSVAIHHHCLFSEQGSPFPHYFSDTHSSCHITNSDVWQLDNE